MGTIIGFIIWTICGAIFILFGLYALRARKPVRFWNCLEPVQVRDIKKYNHAVAKLWIVSAAVFIAAGLPMLMGQNSAWLVITILGTAFWAITLMAVYTKIEQKYRI